jgi:F-type H+-transporting ATPase subunit delta
MAGRYAQALFALAQERNALDQVAKDLAAFDAMIAESADLARLVRSPAFSPWRRARESGRRRSGR